MHAMLLFFFWNPAPNPCGISDSKQSSYFEVQKPQSFESLKSWNFDPNQKIALEKSSYCVATPRLVFEWYIRQGSEREPFCIFFTTQILVVFGPQNSSIAWDLLYQTYPDRYFCSLLVNLSFEGWYNTFLDHFCFVCTWCDLLKKLVQCIVLKFHFSEHFCRALSLN